MQHEMTDEIRSLIQATRAEFFDAATSTTTDRPAAEAAAAVIVAPAVDKYEVHWVASPDEGASLWGSLSASLWGSLRGSLWDSLSASLRGSLWDSPWDSLSASLRDSLRDSLSASLWGSLRDSLWGSLSASLSASLSDSLRDSLRDSLWGSLRDSLCDSGWTAYWVCAVRITGHTGTDAERIEAFAALLRSAFAIWVLPGHVILCEKPTHVVVTDGRLISLEWKGAV